MKGDWKLDARLIIDDEVVAIIKTNKIMSSSVSNSLTGRRSIDQAEINPDSC